MLVVVGRLPMRQLRLDELVGVHELEELRDGVRVLGLLQHRVEVVGVADDVVGVARAAGDGREVAVAEVALGEVRVGRLLRWSTPRSPSARSAALPVASSAGEPPSVNLTESKLLPKAPASTSCLSMRQRPSGCRRSPQALLSPPRAFSNRPGAGDPVVDVLEPHQGRPLVAAAERDRGDALGLEGLARRRAGRPRSSAAVMPASASTFLLSNSRTGWVPRIGMP